LILVAIRGKMKAIANPNRAPGVKGDIEMGTWAIPKTKSDLKRAEAAINLLEAFKILIYPVVGDDDLFDHIGKALERIKQLIQIGDSS